MAMLRRSVDLEAGTCDPRRHEVSIRVPCKKMKKRRELDALIAKSHKTLSAVYKSGGSSGFPGPHGPLLKNDSDSGSDLEGFPSVVSPKHQSACCKSSSGRSSGGLWIPAWLFLIVLIGTLVSATLLWLHIGLKQDFTLLRNHLAKVDAEGKRVFDTFREVDQRFAQLQANQSQIAKRLEQLNLRLNQIARDVSLVNGSAQQIRGSIAEAVNTQLPGHLSRLNGSVHELQSQIIDLSGKLATVRMELTAVEGRSQHRIKEAINIFNTSIEAIEDVIAGRDATSTLSHEFNVTIEQAIGRAQSESDSRFDERMSNKLQELKQTLASLPAPSLPIPQESLQLMQNSGGQQQSQCKTQNDPIPNEKANKAQKSESVSGSAMSATTAESLLSPTNRTIVIADLPEKKSSSQVTAVPAVA
ncbi:uncharacterized protein LOC111268433 isoform X1 [Varroa jacobsoni]|uniref:uncharacterized protein LOC111268433 isoform X1 n=1 Tax=Varroa jacobsoni TaxID=62625 RepID=UPI000BF4F603|nr:uncharacterized protein LOC111268433 isoform X1 [Varroa jacobsoni]